MAAAAGFAFSLLSTFGARGFWTRDVAAASAFAVRDGLAGSLPFAGFFAVPDFEVLGLSVLGLAELDLPTLDFALADLPGAGLAKSGSPAAAFAGARLRSPPRGVGEPARSPRAALRGPAKLASEPLGSAAAPRGACSG